MGKLLKSTASESERKRPKAEEQTSIKLYCYLERWSFVLCSITGQKTGRKTEPETTALLSALKAVHGGQQQS